MHELAEGNPVQGVDHVFVNNLMGQVGKQLNLGEAVVRQVQADALARIVMPRRSEIFAPIQVERLQQENRDMLAAFRSALNAVPRQLLDESILRWRDNGEAHGSQPLREVLHRLESRLNDLQMSQIYSGCVNFLDRNYYKSQTIPVTWDGFRFRLLFAAAGDITPRGHLNYFCNYSARVIELLTGRGYDQKYLRGIVESAIQNGGEYVRVQRQDHFSRQIQDAVHEMGDSLQNILRVVEEVVRNVSAAATVVGESKERLIHSLNSYRTRRAKLIRNLTQVESSGLPLPDGLRERLQEVVGFARELLSNRDTLADHPERLTALAQRIKILRRKAQAISFEFRRVRRKSETLLRRMAGRPDTAPEELEPGTILHREQRQLAEAANALIWSYQDTAYAMALQDALPQPELMRVKAAMLDEKTAATVIGQLEANLRRKPFDVFRFRMAGKKMLSMVLAVLQPVPPAEIAQKAEEDGLWATLADLSDAHQRFALLVEGDEAERLKALPGVIRDLQSTLGQVRQDKVLSIAITPALDREKRVQEGRLRLSMAERLENLQTPLQELLRVSLRLTGGDMAFALARQRAMHTLGVTRDAEPQRGSNYLAELTVVPQARQFLPCDPRYGRGASELERRLQRGPIPGLLPDAMLYGIRQENSLQNLGRREEALEREERARRLVNRSGLLGVEMGLHPLWDEITDSDESQMLAVEMRPLFSGDAGQGFLSRIISDNLEYMACVRLDDDEKMAEANLLLEALTHRNGFSPVQETIFAAARLLAGEELAAQLGDRRFFLLNQRRLLGQLGVEDLLEFLRPESEFVAPGLLGDLDGLLDGLDGREQELVLLQLYHRRFLQADLLTRWLQIRYSSPDVLVAQAPGLVSELLERYHWLLRNPGHSGEIETMATVLEALEMEHARQAVEEGVARLARVRGMVARYRVLMADRDMTLTGRLLTFIRGQEVQLRRLARELAEEMERLNWLGLAREARLLKLEMLRPLEE